MLSCLTRAVDRRARVTAHAFAPSVSRSQRVARIAAAHVHLVDLGEHVVGERIGRQGEGVEVLSELLHCGAADDDRAVRLNKGPRAAPQDGELRGREVRTRGDGGVFLGGLVRVRVRVRVRVTLTLTHP